MARPRSKEPWLGQRDGVWYVFWYDAEKRHERRKSLDTRDHVTAATRFAEFLVRGVDDPADRRSLPGLKATVTQVLDWYDKDHISTIASPERQRYALIPLKKFLGEKLISAIDIEASRTYRKVRTAKEANRPVGASTVRRELGVLVAAANHALKWKRIKPDEIPQVELPVEAETKAPWLTKAAIRVILDKADGDLRDFCLLAYYWGSRRAAVERLKKDQVDLRHGRVDLHAIGARRTKKRRPIVPIYPEIRPTIERLLAASDSEWLFGHDRREFYTAFKKLCSDHGIRAVDAPEDETPWPHLLRHSRATHLLMDGEDPYKVAKLLGDTMATVERVYGHHSVEYLATTKGQLYEVG